MLKPRYGTMAESIGDFNRMLDGMNKVQPLERKFTDDIQEMFTHEQKLVGLEKQIEHAHRVAAGSGMQMDVTESDNLAAMHAHAADMYGQAAVRAAEKVRDALAVNNRQMAERFQGIVTRFREKAVEHQQQAKRSGAVVAEAKQAARNPLFENFRALAGLEERPFMPRNIGVVRNVRVESCEVQVDEGRSKGQQLKGQEAMMARSFPKRHAQWSKDQADIVARGGKVKDDERAVPRFLNKNAGKVKDDPENDKP